MRCGQHRFHAIQAEEYILSKRITILLQQVNEAAELEIPVLHKASLSWLELTNYPAYHFITKPHDQCCNDR